MKRGAKMFWVIDDTGTRIKARIGHDTHSTEDNKNPYLVMYTITGSYCYRYKNEIEEVQP